MVWGCVYGPGGVHGPGGCMVPGGVHGPGEGVHVPRGVVSQHALRQTPPPPPVNRMTADRCKNITLPQTSFESGNNAPVVNEGLSMSFILKI